MNKMKRVIGFFLIISMLFVMMESLEAKAAGISVSDATYPDWIRKGEAFILKGTVKSDSNITELTASLCDGHGKAVYSKTVKPNSKSYSLKGIDSAMRFDKLSANPYTYRVEAKDASGSHSVILKPFTVYEGRKPEYVTEIDTSKKFQISLEENSNLVLDVDGGEIKDNVLVKENTKNAASYWYLEKAEAGSYLIRNAETGYYLDVEGGSYLNGANVWQYKGNNTDAQKWYFVREGDGYKILSKRNYLTLSLNRSIYEGGKNVQMWRDIQVAHQRFFLCPEEPKTEEKPASTLAVSDANEVPTLTAGSVFSLKGKITSNYKIKEVNVQVAGADKGTTILKKVIYPNAVSATLSGEIDKGIRFNDLPAGNYYYSVWAEDVSGMQKTLIWQPFTVKAADKKNKTLSVNWKNIAKVGNQAGPKNGKSSDSCFCFALAYSRTILDGKVHTWSEYDANNVKSGKHTQYDASGWFGKAGFKKKTPSTQNSVYKTAYESINAGKPCIVFVKGKRSSWHYVAIVGYQNVTSTETLSAKNFLMIDSCPGTTKKAVENLQKTGYSLKKSGKNYQCFITK